MRNSDWALRLLQMLCLSDSLLTQRLLMSTEQEDMGPSDRPGSAVQDEWVTQCCSAAAVNRTSHPCGRTVDLQSSLSLSIAFRVAPFAVLWVEIVIHAC